MTANLYPKVYLIILNWNGKADTLECLSSIRQVSYPNFTTVVVDNGSADGSVEAIKAAFPEVLLLQNSENLGYAEGNNVGMRYAMDNGADYVLVLNNDTIVDPAFISSLVSVAEDKPNAAILGPKIYFYDRPDIINSAGGHINYETLERGHIGYGFREDGVTYSDVAPVEWITGCALLFRVSALRKIGLFDENFFLICEELDLCARARKLGYDIQFVPDSKMWHKVSAAFEGNYSAVYCYYMFRNILLYAHNNFPDRRFPLYWKLLQDSRLFYLRLKEGGDPDYRRKGFCIMMGTISFFTGALGKGPSWIFQVKIPKKVYQPDTLTNDSKEIFSATIEIGESVLTGKAGAIIMVPVKVTNLSEGTWPAFASNAVRLSYHIRDQDGKVINWDGLRTTLRKDLRATKSMKLDAVVQLPPNAGRYTLEWDLVQETVAWFGKEKSATVKMDLDVLLD